MRSGNIDRKIKILFLIPLIACFSGSLVLDDPGSHPKEYQTHPAYSLLEQLVRIPPQVTVFQVSSHNKKGVNGDADWPLYKDSNGDDVIFDAAGPGCIKSMWGTSFDPNGILQFYFDGEKEPRIRINIIDFYKGKHRLFPAPLVSYEKRGMWGDLPYAGNCFVPIPFSTSLKISIKGGSTFFHIIYEKYPYPTETKSFTGKEDRSALTDCFERMGELPFEPLTLDTLKTETEAIEPGQTVSLLKMDSTSGIIREIFIESDGAEDFFQKTLLKMRWDDHSRWDVQAPPGIFFGSAVKADDMRSLPLRVEKLKSGKVRLHCFFPMPFWKKAEIEWTNTTSRKMAPMKARILVGKNPVSREEGTYFTTLYNNGQTIYGHDWLLFEGKGSGWFVGVVQSMLNSHYCEGNEHFTIDGVMTPQFLGTGTEDYYLGCFWPNLDFDTPFGCVAGDITVEGGGDYWGSYNIPSSYSRFHLEAPLSFSSSIDARIQHGGLSDVISNYRSIAFCYLQKNQRLHQTDLIDVGSPASEEIHSYRASASGPVVKMSAFPEGDNFEVLTKATGRYHTGGEVRFTVAVDSANEGVKLRRLIDQKNGRQKALVYIDGEYAGCWYNGYTNEYLRWSETDFEIHPRFTRGKQSLDVKLEIKTDGGEDPFSDFTYKVFCYHF